jgi:hypothetical protein
LLRPLFVGWFAFCLARSLQLSSHSIIRHCLDRASWINCSALLGL